MWPCTVSGASPAISCRQLARGGERVVGQPLDEADDDGFLSIDRTAGEQEVACRALTDEHREPRDVGRAQEDAEAAAGNGEPRVGARDADVARDRELHARADRGAVDRGDHRRGIVDDRVEHLLERGTEGVGAAAAAVGEAGPEIGARAERGSRRR